MTKIFNYKDDENSEITIEVDENGNLKHIGFCSLKSVPQIYSESKIGLNITKIALVKIPKEGD